MRFVPICRYTILDKTCDTLESASCDCGGCDCLGDFVTSCQEIYSLDATSDSGAYSILLADGESESVMCDMATSGGGWTLVATVTSDGTSWQYGDDDGDAGDLASAWESNSTFGSYDDDTADFKGRAWSLLPKDQIMITCVRARVTDTRRRHRTRCTGERPWWRTP